MLFGEASTPFVFSTFISLLPTVSYRFAEKWNVTAGTSIDYRKLVNSEWNPFRASLHSNGDDPSWRLNAIPLTLGVTYTLSPQLRIFPFICAYPIAIQRKHLASGKQAEFLETASFGMWLSGTLF